MASVAGALCLLASLVVVTAQSLFGFPGHRYDPFSAFDPFAPSRNYNRYAHAFEEPFLPPCPKYRPLQLGEWQEVVTPSGGAYQMHAELPWVRHSDRQAQISADGQSIQILGLRPVPTRGRDGRFEILEASAHVPPGDISRATVRQTRHGLDIVVPARRVLQVDPRERKNDVTDEAKQQFDGAVPPEVNEAAEWRATPKMPRETKVTLPPSDGIEVVEEEYDFPEKDADASEGWIDIRGEFQPY